MPSVGRVTHRQSSKWHWLFPNLHVATAVMASTKAQVQQLIPVFAQTARDWHDIRSQGAGVDNKQRVPLSTVISYLKLVYRIPGRLV